MDFYKRSIDMPRGTQKVRLEINNHDGYLCKIYDLPDPATGGEYMDALDDLKERFDEGERSEFNTGDGMLGCTVEV